MQIGLNANYMLAMRAARDMSFDLMSIQIRPMAVPKIISAISAWRSLIGTDFVLSDAQDRKKH
jgi:hypothetical protein